MWAFFRAARTPAAFATLFLFQTLALNVEIQGAAFCGVTADRVDAARAITRAPKLPQPVTSDARRRAPSIRNYGERVAHEDARHFVWVEALVPQRGGARLEGDGREYLNLG